MHFEYHILVAENYHNKNFMSSKIILKSIIKFKAITEFILKNQNVFIKEKRWISDGN